MTRGKRAPAVTDKRGHNPVPDAEHAALAENSTESARKSPGRPFRRGESGNPGGRPKIVAHVRALAQEHTARAIAVLVEALDSDDERVRIVAANSILDRGYGRPGHAEGELEETRRREVQIERDVREARKLTTSELRQIVDEERTDDA